MLIKEKTSSYCIIVDSGNGLCVLDRTGCYKKEISNAMTFIDKLDALCCTEKRGFEKIARIAQISN